MDRFDKILIDAMKSGFEQRLDDIDYAEERGDHLLRANYIKGALAQLEEIFEKFPEYRDEIIHKKTLVVLRNENKKEVHNGIDELIQKTEELVKKAKSPKQKRIHLQAAIKRLDKIEYYNGENPRVSKEYSRLFYHKMTNIPYQ